MMTLKKVTSITMIIPETPKSRIITHNALTTISTTKKMRRMRMKEKKKRECVGVIHKREHNAHLY
jgi:hypothetical protein